MTKRNTIEINSGVAAPLFRLEREFNLDEGGWLIRTFTGSRLTFETVAPTDADSRQALHEDAHRALDLALNHLVGPIQPKEKPF